MSSAAGDLARVIYSFHYQRFTPMLVPHRCQTWSLVLCWFVVTDQLKDSCLYRKGGVEMLFLCDRQVHSPWMTAVHMYLMMSCIYTKQLIESTRNFLKISSFCWAPLLFFPSHLLILPFHAGELGSLVIYSCHSRESATLVMLLPHFSNSVCAPTDLFPDCTLFLPPCSFPLPKFFLFFCFF